MTVVQPSFRTPDLPASGVHHGLHRQDHPGQEPGTVSGGAEIGDLRGLMELGAHAMAHKVADHGVPVLLHILLDRVGDVGDPGCRVWPS